ncbi:AAA family ATPase [bacterium]|nr:AAA family ATPase [bacterium]
MITLQKLKWDNCFSYGSGNELDLDDNTVTQIIGTNGMGKSSIPLIIEEALYNKNSKGIKKVDIPNRYVNDGYNISLSFEKDESNYLITVQRKGSIKVKLEKDGEDISSHTATNTYKSIQAILGIDFKTFSQLVYQNTNASLQFLTATDANRKKFLIDLLQLEHYVDLFEVFKAAAKEATTKRTTASAKLATAERWLKNNKLTDTDILPMLKVESDLEKYEEDLQHWTTQLSKIAETNRKIETNNLYKKQLSAIDINAVNSDTTQLIDVDSIVSEHGEVKAAATGAQKTLAKLERLKEECPTCKQPIDISVEKEMIAVEREKLSKAKERLSELTTEIQGIKDNNRRFERNQEVIRNWEQLFQVHDANLSTSLLDVAECEARVETGREGVQTEKSILQGITQQNQERTKRNTRIQVIQEQTDEFEAQCAKYTNELKIVEKHEGTLDILKKAFSTNGLLAYKIENLVKELEELVNTYLAELSDGRFTLEFVVSNDKLNVQITDTGNIIDILALSSGELARVNTATLLAIRKLMGSISKSRINVLFLDEVINVLDETGRERMVEVLLREDLNTYIVSHGWTHPLLEKIEVVKNGNVSSLE